MLKPLPSNDFFDEELQVRHKQPFFQCPQIETIYSVQPLPFGLSSNVENFYHDGTFLEGCLEYTRVTARVKGNGLRLDGFLREQE